MFIAVLFVIATNWKKKKKTQMSFCKRMVKPKE